MILLQTIYMASFHPVSFQTSQCSSHNLPAISHPGRVLLCLLVSVTALSPPWNVLPGLFYQDLSQEPLLGGRLCQPQSDITRFSQFGRFALPYVMAHLCLPLLLELKAHV